MCLHLLLSKAEDVYFAYCCCATIFGSFTAVDTLCCLLVMLLESGHKMMHAHVFCVLNN